MPLPFSTLTAAPTFAQWQALIILALQGLGIITPSNGSSGAPVGTGSVALSGTPTLPSSLSSPANAIAKISTSGEPGAAQVQISIDNGATYAAAVTIPSNGAVAVTGTQGTTGVTITFTAGPTGTGTSFISGDQYAFLLTTPSFPTTAWQAGSTPRTLAMIDAQALTDLGQLASAIAAGGIAAINPATGLPYASGPWADLLGQNVYGLTRNPAIATIGLASLLDANAQGPFTIAVGQLVAAATNGQLYQNSTGGTLTKGLVVPAGGISRSGGNLVTVTAVNSFSVNQVVTLVGGEANFPAGPKTITFASGGGFQYSEAGSNVTSTSQELYALPLQLSWTDLVPGSAGNVANNTLTSLNTPLPGVTLNNPDPGSGTWITTQGTDPETDLAYLTRCTGRWSSLGIGATAATYDSWARTADPTIVKTLVQLDSVIPGQVDVYCAGTSGPVGGGAVTNAQNYINARLPLGFSCVVAATTGVVVTVTGTVFYYSAKTTAAAVQAAVANALTALINASPIGTDNTPTKFVYLNQIIGAIENAFGVRNVVLSSPSADTGLLLGQQATLTNNLSGGSLVGV